MARDKFSSNCETFVELEGLSQSCKILELGFRLSLCMARDKFSSNCETFVELEGLSQSFKILELGQKTN